MVPRPLLAAAIVVRRCSRRRSLRIAGTWPLRSAVAPGAACCALQVLDRGWVEPDFSLQVLGNDEDGAVALPYDRRRLVSVERRGLGWRRVGERVRGQWRGLR